ncbi:MAG: FMN-binding protein, partial [Oscillospiraceae bacterium]|nr:FMN-binding protein [Oscillospiraceae bacterium]
MKKALSLCLCLCLLFSLAAVGHADGFTEGSYTASAQGFGGVVSVKLTVDSEKVTEIAITGGDETPSVGGKAIEHFNEHLVGISSADDIDGVSGATFPSTAVKTAVADCLAQASGQTPAEAAPL